jgi:hypothetical protein
MFAEKDTKGTGFRLLHMAGDPMSKYSILILCDALPTERELRLLKNFQKLGREIVIFMPDTEGPYRNDFDFAQIFSVLKSFPEKLYIVSIGIFAPHLVNNYDEIARNVEKVIFINPTYRKDISTKMSGFELPVLVITSTPGNLDHDPDAVKYHDLISGSVISYVRGVHGNPLFKRFTQSFNSIQRFLQNE